MGEWEFVLCPMKKREKWAPMMWSRIYETVGGHPSVCPVYLLTKLVKRHIMEGLGQAKAYFTLI